MTRQREKLIERIRELKRLERKGYILCVNRELQGMQLVLESLGDTYEECNCYNCVMLFQSKELIKDELSR